MKPGWRSQRVLFYHREFVGIHNAAPRRVGVRNLHGVQAHRGERRKLPSGNLYFAGIPYAVHVCVVELVDAQLGRVTRATAAFSDLEVVGLRAVIREAAFGTHPYLVLSTSIVGVIVPRSLV